MPRLLISLIGLFGVVVGSFLNVLIYRIPIKRSIVSPPSACLSCESAIRAYDNIPILSWIILNGKCRSCQARISIRYPLVELSSGVAFAVIAWKFHGGTLLMFALLYLYCVSIVLAMIDLDTHTLPNQIVLPSYLVGAALLGAEGILRNDYGALLRAGIGMISLSLIYLALALIYPGGMGLGDVKFAGVLGLFLGFLSWKAFFVGAFSAFIFGGIFALGLLATRKAKPRTGIAFGPWMLVGAWVGVFFGVQIVEKYFSLFGLTTQLGS